MTTSILNGSVSRGLVITPKPLAPMSGLIMDIIKSELSRSGRDLSDISRQCLAALDSVMLSLVFDVDGLWQTLSDLEPPAGTSITTSTPSEAAPETKIKPLNGSPESEIRDSDDEELSQTADHTCAISQCHTRNLSRKSPSIEPPPITSVPDIIVITHFSTLLTSLFATREKSAAHKSLALLKALLRRLSTTVDTNSLIILLNCNISDSNEAQRVAEGSSLSFSVANDTKLNDSTFRSVFSMGPSSRSIRPRFGTVFSQFLDLHISCTRFVTQQAVLPHRYHGTLSTASEKLGSYRNLALIEILQDDVKADEPSDTGRNREQRWALLELANHLIVNAFPLYGKLDGTARLGSAVSDVYEHDGVRG